MHQSVNDYVQIRKVIPFLSKVWKWVRTSLHSRRFKYSVTYHDNAPYIWATDRDQWND